MAKYSDRTRSGLALALAVDGSQCGITYCPDVACRTGGAINDAVRVCEENSKVPCRLYAIRDEVVWREDLPAEDWKGALARKPAWYESFTRFEEFPVSTFYTRPFIRARKEGLESYQETLKSSPGSRGVFAVGYGAYWGFGISSNGMTDEEKRLEAAKNALRSCEQKANGSKCKLWMDHDRVIYSGKALEDVLNSVD